jgi:hypothetical protein
VASVTWEGEVGGRIQSRDLTAMMAGLRRIQHLEACKHGVRKENCYATPAAAG